MAQIRVHGTLYNDEQSHILANADQIVIGSTSVNKENVKVALEDLYTSKVSVSNSGSATDIASYITVGSKEYKISGGGGGTSDYNALSNRPSINGVTLSGNKTTSDLGITIPTKTSQLTNDSGFLTEHQSLSSYRTAAAQDVIDNTKVNKVEGKGLSTNDYTTTEQTKLAGIAAGAEVNVQSDWNQSDSTLDDYIKNKPTIPTKTSQLTNDSRFLIEPTTEGTSGQVLATNGSGGRSWITVSGGGAGVSKINVSEGLKINPSVGVGEVTISSDIFDGVGGLFT